MRCRPLPALLLAAVLLSGCVHQAETTPIAPLPAAEGRVNPGLGPGAAPLSSGPGYKGSPSWSPAGDRVAFVVDGYVVDRTAGGGRLTRWTTRDLAATGVVWTAEGVLTVLGGAEDGPLTAYRTDSRGDGSLGVREVAEDVLTMARGPGGEELVLALKTEPGGSAISLLRSGRMERVYTERVPGSVTGLSFSPDGERLVLAVRPPGKRLSSKIYVFGLDGGGIEEIPGPGGSLSVVGAPQWTDHGIYFVAGAAYPPGGGEPRYDLYRTAPGAEGPEQAPGVSGDFVAGGARVSPEGDRLAVVGRLNPKSPLNLYVLDLRTERLVAVTTNEDMEIKTGPNDLAWSPAGTSVTIVARGASTGEPEVRAAPADELLDTFYNLYEIPVTPHTQPGTPR